MPKTLKAGAGVSCDNRGISLIVTHNYDIMRSLCGSGQITILALFPRIVRAIQPTTPNEAPHACHEHIPLLGHVCAISTTRSL